MKNLSKYILYPMPLRVAGVYALAAGLWIVFSDRILAWFVRDVAWLTMLQTYKGWFFVIATALLLWVALRREARKVQLANQESLESLNKANRLNRALQTLSDGNHALIHAEKVEHLLKEICCTAVQIGGYRFAWVNLVEPYGSREGPPVASFESETTAREPVVIPSPDTDLGRGLSEMAIGTAKVQIGRDMLNDPAFSRWGETVLYREYRSAIALPLLDNGKAFGALNIYAIEADAFNAEEVALLMKLAGDLAYGIVTLHGRDERRKTRQSLQRQLDRLAALRAIDLAITSTLELPVILDVLLTQVLKHLNVDAADVLLFDDASQTLNFVAAKGFAALSEEYGIPITGTCAGRAITERHTVFVSNIMDEPWLSCRCLLDQEGFMAYYAVPLSAKDHSQGVLEVYCRTWLDPAPEWISFAEALARQAAIAIENATLFQDLQHTNAELTLAYEKALEGWVRALDLRDKETEGHTQRVTEMSIHLARLMGLAEADLVQIRRGALLHDIGKIGVSDTILLKQGPLTDPEKDLMRQHPQHAYELLSPIPYFASALDIPYYHHERWDGSGYPCGLKEEQIPLAARIFAIVDVWDAICSQRPYHKELSPEAALEYIQGQSGRHFDPQVVQAFLAMLNELAR